MSRKTQNSVAMRLTLMGSKARAKRREDLLAKLGKFGAVDAWQLLSIEALERTCQEKGIGSR